MRATALTLALTLWTGAAAAQSFELDRQLRDCLREQAKLQAGEPVPAPKGDLKQAAGRLLGRCESDAAAWLRVCRGWGSEAECSRATDVRAVSALQDGKPSGGAGGHH
jgi:hypothetical protein